MNPLDIPFLGARTAIWIVAELHLFFAAFILGAPMFIVLCEYLGYRGGDQRYERLAKETMKVTVIAYSFTAVMGGIFLAILLTSYQNLTMHLFDRFGPIWLWYFVLIPLEVACMYVYWYSWDVLKEGAKKLTHIWIGVALNVIGTAVLLLVNSVASYMLTPPEVEDPTIWQLLANPSWTGLVLHRFIANITFGGFIVALFAAFMFLYSKSREEKAFYDWMGFTGTLIGVGTLLTLPLAGYIYAKELFHYSAAISTFFMADALAPYFVVQGLLVTMIFLIANYYMWVSIDRIEGAQRFARYRSPVFSTIFVLGGIWVLPAHFLPNMSAATPAGWVDADIFVPEKAAVLAQMPPKALAVTGILLITFLTYMIYIRAMNTGKIVWGNIAPQSQYALIAVGGVVVYLMGLMGAIRELTRQDWHVFQQVPDATHYWYTTPLSYASAVNGVITILFFAMLAFIFWVGFLLGRKEEPAA